MHPTHLNLSSVPAQPLSSTQPHGDRRAAAQHSATTRAAGRALQTSTDVFTPFATHAQTTARPSAGVSYGYAITIEPDGSLEQQLSNELIRLGSTQLTITGIDLRNRAFVTNTGNSSRSIQRWTVLDSRDLSSNNINENDQVQVTRAYDKGRVQIVMQKINQVVHANGGISFQPAQPNRR